MSSIHAELTILMDMGMVIAAAAILANFAKALRQPLLVGYVLAGIIIGPEALGLIRNPDVVRIFAELGIGFLLFMVGLELDLSKLRKIKKVVFFSAISSIVVMMCIGVSVSGLMGFLPIESLYIGLFVAFSSTAVLVKLLSDTAQIDTLHGRIMIGILLLEDVAAVLAISMLSSLSFELTPILISLGKGGLLLGASVLFGQVISPWFFRKIDDSQELVFITALTYFFGFIAISIHWGFTAAVGGFLAGVSLTAFPVNLEIASRASSLRDFFTTIFFVSLGMLVNLQGFLQILWLFLLLLVVVIVFKPILSSAIVSLFGYGEKTSFLTGIGRAQVSEFSLVIALQGLLLGHIGQDIFSLAVGLMIVTIIITTYIFGHQNAIYTYIGDKLITFPGSKYEERHKKELKDHVILIGAHLGGKRILNSLGEDGEVLIIDYDPETIDEMRQEGFHTLYGDIRNPEIFKKANVDEAKAVISTIPGNEKNMFVVEHVKRNNPDAVVIVSSRSPRGALKMYSMGADYVLYPHTLAGKEASDIVRKLYDKKDQLEEAKDEEVEDLRKVL